MENKFRVVVEVVVKYSSILSELISCEVLEKKSFLRLDLFAATSKEDSLLGEMSTSILYLCCLTLLAIGEDEFLFRHMYTYVFRFIARGNSCSRQHVLHGLKTANLCVQSAIVPGRATVNMYSLDTGLDSTVGIYLTSHHVRIWHKALL